MKVVVFHGPTIPRDEVERLLPSATSAPPAGCGDVYTAARDGANVVVLIDGVFDHRLAVWHKEVLWALQHGAVVIGGASMGALRAAELAEFGMVGVGRIFEWFRDERLEDDDEVAVAHADADGSYAPASEAMVNVRVTLANALRDGVLSEADASLLAHVAKALYFPERCYPAILAGAIGRGFDASTSDEFQRWLPRGRVDQKRLDARDALAVAARAAAGPRPEAAARRFRFECTEAWLALQRRLDRTPATRKVD